MTEEPKHHSTDIWDATVYTGLYCLLQCAQIRSLYSQSVDLAELEMREKSLIQAIVFALEMLKIPDLLQDFHQNVRTESGQLNSLWIEGHGLIFAARHPTVLNQIENDRLTKKPGDECMATIRFPANDN